MEAENHREYQLIRKELLELKDCITTYVGFVLGGAGAALFGVSVVLKSGKISAGIALAPFLLSIVISLVLLILFYKFLSHNRYAGYCKLLNQEQYVRSRSGRRRASPDFMFWEMCMSYLRKADYDFKAIDGLITEAEEGRLDREIELRKEVEVYQGPKPEIDKGAFWKGSWLVLRALVGNVVVRSWGYPLFIVIVFTVLAIVFITVGWVLVCDVKFVNPVTSEVYSKFWLYFVAGAITVAQILAWIRYMCWTHRLLNGSRQVNAFCWRFVPMRCVLVTKHDATIWKYRILGKIP